MSADATSAMTAGGGVAVLDEVVRDMDRLSEAGASYTFAPEYVTKVRQARKAIAELIAAAANVSERIAYYAELGENATPTIEDWAYTDQSGDVARLRSALAALEQQS